MFLDGHSVVVPPDIARVTKSMGQSMDFGHCGMEWKIGEVNLGRKNLFVTLSEARQNS
jgi:hypothetical protein